ncbi:hypothetical protein B0A50_04296 [Salinomyces thailandicus]|uniref:Uncharacterized protein n=1 Tax=Salinomyces thailandicus TaxID=706561 RepID=A0A4U0TWQ8_9PEZI|nr:hypothetical protein B0A50_04296 [Salinomyces thailandica]
MSSSTFTSSSYSYTSSTSSNGQTTTGQRAAQQTYTDPSGATTIQQTAQNMGDPMIQETKRYDAAGNQLLEGAGAGRIAGAGAGMPQGRIEEVGDDERKARGREYEERMEEEYAKREGGA